MNTSSTDATPGDPEILYTSEYPLSVTAGLILDLIAVTLFLYEMIFNFMPVTNGVFFSILSCMLVDFVICPHAGKIQVYRSRIRFIYYFPWNRNVEFDMNSIQHIEVVKPRWKFYGTIYITTNTNETKGYSILSRYQSTEGIEIIRTLYNQIKSN